MPECLSLIASGLDPVVACRIDPALARRHLILPFAESAEAIHVAVADPAVFPVLDQLAREWGKRVEPCLEEARLVRNAIRIAFSDTACADQTSTPAAHRPGAADITPASELGRVEWLCASAARRGASDIHLEPRADGLRLRQRVDGRLSELARLSREEGRAAVARLKVLAGLNLIEHRRPQDGRLSLNPDGRPMAFRVSILPSIGGEAVVLRATGGREAFPDGDALGLAPELEAVLRAEISRPDGLVAIVGPTGSGKSTTAWSCLRTLDPFQNKIITLEDPVEAPLPGVHQVSVQAEQGLGFADVLRASLRHAPDYLFVGEIRDRETAEIALQAAMTGHRVLTTVHGDDPVAALARFERLGIHPARLAEAVRGLLAQRLVRRLCPHCRVPAALDPAAAAFVRRRGHRLPERVFVPAGGGCARCRGAGFRGRVGLFSWLAPQAVAEAVRARDWNAVRSAMVAPEHPFTMLADALAKIASGTVHAPESLGVVSVADGFYGLNTLCPGGCG